GAELEVLSGDGPHPEDLSDYYIYTRVAETGKSTPHPRGCFSMGSLCKFHVNFSAHTTERRTAARLPTVGGWAVYHTARRRQSNELIQLLALAFRACDHSCGARRDKRLEGVLALPTGVFVKRHQTLRKPRRLLAAFLIEFAG